MILAIDPGKDKCGVAVMEKWGEVLEKSVIGREHLPAEILRICFGNKVEKIAVGESAAGRAVERELKKFGLLDGIVFVPEKDSSRLARERYWRENPPKGFWRLVPTSLRFPPVPIDDYAAVVIGERYLATLPRPS
ncbi:hypothetical protein A2625_00305 [candidate division WOR-1 bacterium RIFCSPHIGHO2_01_FULL_53_15]|uniref:YqgF/RNase H-like domain-containing protein n=1 Tax=candidate division WOR-1 bacterium RIFCSPHIGHO2_01_FULL_53_15 TaxID=1802564 RepID=A0A1F4PZ76_UNCSA|nr:MAG: hypothetical protein A2625_00305 [candidate division WOR-1 bacterium RIFCSPHIGHO2_01_FULL_53_15]OGC10464.1 MAG: hypothetical protein A3D23_03395 [candidate division WOR-1 bacterium RIFCSPHIGHO2_02_FULL_53_26]